MLNPCSDHLHSRGWEMKAERRQTHRKRSRRQGCSRIWRWSRRGGGSRLG